MQTVRTLNGIYLLASSMRDVITHTHISLTLSSYKINKTYTKEKNEEIAE